MLTTGYDDKRDEVRLAAAGGPQAIIDAAVLTIDHDDRQYVACDDARLAAAGVPQAIIDAALAWVDDMRANVATLAADPDADFSDDANWPECPADVTALAERF